MILYPAFKYCRALCLPCSKSLDFVKDSQVATYDSELFHILLLVLSYCGLHSSKIWKFPPKVPKILDSDISFVLNGSSDHT